MTSVFKHFSFHGFLQPRNLETYYKKLETEPKIETWQHMSLFVETCLQFLTGSSQALQNHTILLMNFLFRFPETQNPAKNQQKPGNFFSQLLMVMVTCSEPAPIEIEDSPPLSATVGNS